MQIMKKIFCLMVLACTHALLYGQTITTVTGGNLATSLYTGENVQALTASFFPHAIVKDSHGNMYVADYVDSLMYSCSPWPGVPCDLYYSRIRKITTGGIVTTFAGGGMSAADGIAATAAKLNHPNSLAIDRYDNIYYADAQRNKIRKISPSGIITTVAGIDSLGYNGDGIAATTAKLNYPTGVSVDTSGNVYIADRGNHRIRKVTVSGIIQTIAGIASAGYSGDGGPATAAELSDPSAVYADAHGNIYISDFGNYCIRKINSSGTIRRVAGTTTAGHSGDGGAATSANIFTQYGLVADNNGRIVFTNDSEHYVRIVDTSGLIYTICGTGTGAFSGDGGSSITAKTFKPLGLFGDASGNLLIADHNNQRIREISPAGTIRTVAGNGNSFCDSMTANGKLSAVNNIYYDTTLKELLITVGELRANSGIYQPAIFGNHVSKLKNGMMYSIAGDYIPDTTFWLGSILGGTAKNMPLNFVNGVCKNTAGATILAGDRHLYRLDTSGNLVVIAGTGAPGAGEDSITAMAASFNAVKLRCDRHDNIYILSTDFSTIPPVFIQKITPSGMLYKVAGTSGGYSGNGGPAKSAQMNPTGFDIDSAGNIYIAEGTNHVIRKIDTAGIITLFAGTGTAGYSGDGGPASAAQLNYPQDLAIDRQGNIVFTDIQEHRIRKISTSGIITTIAGTGTAGYTGDGGSPISANINIPSSLAFDEHNNVLFADYAEGCVRKISVGTTRLESQSTQKVTIYPNPNKGRFTIVPVAGLTGTATVSVKDILGRTITTITGNAAQPIELNIPTPPGVYILTIGDAMQQFTERFIVE
jgi:sugar lactone lactonase YvrE